MTRKHYPTKMARFEFIPQSDYNIKSGKFNVFSNGRIIGYAGDKEMTNFKPVSDWPYRFSKSLIRELGLDTTQRRG